MVQVIIYHIQIKRASKNVPFRTSLQKIILYPHRNFSDAFVHGDTLPKVEERVGKILPSTLYELGEGSPTLRNHQQHPNNNNNVGTKTTFVFFPGIRISQKSTNVS